MISSNYLTHANNILHELFNSLTDDDKEYLQTLLNHFKQENKLLEIENHYLENEVRKYIKATVKERSKIKKWNENRNYKLLLIFYSFKYLYKGYSLLKFVNSLPNNGPYRDVVTIYSTMANKLNVNNDDYLVLFDDILYLQ